MEGYVFMGWMGAMILGNLIYQVNNAWARYDQGRRMRLLEKRYCKYVEEMVK
jgi:hypothetical protein